MIAFLHRMGEQQRQIGEFARLTDYQVVEVYLKPAAKIAAERQRRMDGGAGGMSSADAGGDGAASPFKPDGTMRVPGKQQFAAQFAAFGGKKENVDAEYAKLVAGLKAKHGVA